MSIIPLTVQTEIFRQSIIDDPRLFILSMKDLKCTNYAKIVFSKTSLEAIKTKFPSAQNLSTYTKKIEEAFKTTSLKMLFKDRPAFVMKAELEKVPHLKNESQLLIDMGIDQLSYESTSFEYSTFLKFLEFLDHGQIEEISREDIQKFLPLFSYFKETKQSLYEQHFQQRLIQDKKPFEILTEIFTNTPFTPVANQALLAIVESFLKNYCVDQGITFTSKAQNNAYTVWKTSLFSKKITIIPCLFEIADFLKDSHPQMSQKILGQLDLFVSSNGDPYHDLFMTKEKIASFLSPLSEDTLIQLKKRLEESSTISFFKDLCDLISNDKKNSDLKSKVIYLVNKGHTKKALESAKALPELQQSQIYLEIIKTLLRQKLPAIEMAIKIAAKIKQREMRSEGYEIIAANCLEYQKKSEASLAIQHITSKKRALWVKRLMASYFKAMPLQLEEAQRTAEKFQDEIDPKSLSLLFDAYLQCSPPKMSSAKKIAEMILSGESPAAARVGNLCLKKLAHCENEFSS